MRKLVTLLLCLGLMLLLPFPVWGLEAPAVPSDVRDQMPREGASFSEGLLHILRDLLPLTQSALMESLRVCLRVLAMVLVVGVADAFSLAQPLATRTVAAVSLGTVLLGSSRTMIGLGVETVTRISDYGKLLLPTMTAALAAQGGTTTSAALYTAAAGVNALLGWAISHVIVPLIYLYLGLAIGGAALGEDTLNKLGELAKSVITWLLKGTLYLFTGFMGITGVVSGSTDAAALKAAKLTISASVPVVGGILSDASEAVLVGAEVLKNAVGLYGIFAVLVLCGEPFLRMGAQYLLLKGTAALCAVFGEKESVSLVEKFSRAMGLLLAMTGSVCLLLLISIICFLKGVG